MLMAIHDTLIKQLHIFKMFLTIPAPSGKKYPARIHGNSAKGFDVNFKPSEVGKLSLHRMQWPNEGNKGIWKSI